MEEKEIEAYLKENAVYRTEEVLEQIEKFIDILREEKKDLEAKILGFREIIQADERENEFMYTAYQSMLIKYDNWFGIKAHTQGTINKENETK